MSEASPVRSEVDPNRAHGLASECILTVYAAFKPILYRHQNGRFILLLFGHVRCFGLREQFVQVHALTDSNPTPPYECSHSVAVRPGHAHCRQVCREATGASRRTACGRGQRPRAESPRPCRASGNSTRRRLRRRTRMDPRFFPRDSDSESESPARRPRTVTGLGA